MAIRIVMILLGLSLILAVACGRTPAAPELTAAPAAEPTTAPVVGETVQPTAAPQAVAPPADVEVNPGKLTIMVGDFATERFDVVFVGGAVGGLNYGRIAHGFLISENKEREMLPGIAEDWSLSDDGLTWTFTIREGVKWHDGSELTPEDVFWTLQHYYGPHAMEYDLSLIAKVFRVLDGDGIELSEPNTVSLTTTSPVVDLGIIVSEAGPYWYPVLPMRTEVHDEEDEVAYDNNPVGAGPMKLVSRSPAQVMNFERFDDFYYQPDNGFPEDKRVKFQSLDMFLVPEEATRVAALRAGEADIVPANLPSRQQVETGGGRLIFAPEGVYVWVRLLGCYEPQYPCHDKRVRQALDYAIDKELIRDQLYGGSEVFDVRGWYAVTPGSTGYTPELDWYYDPDKARQLMADAGYPGGQGFGKLILNTHPSSAIPFQVEAAQLGAEFWKRELGLDVEVRVGDSVGIKEKEVAGELNGQIIWRENRTAKDAASTIATVFGEPTRPDPVHQDPELFRLVDETVRIVDEQKRAEALEKLALRLRDESYFLGVGYANIPWGVGPRVETWEPYPMATYPSALHTITLRR